MIIIILITTCLINLIIKLSNISIFEFFDLLIKLVTIILGIIGLVQWRQQFLKKQRFECVKDLLAQVYEVRRRIELFRDPFYSPGHAFEALSAEGRDIPENQEEYNFRGNAALYRKRWNELVNEYIAMKQKKSIAIIVIGRKIGKYFGTLDGCIREMRAAVITYTMDQDRQAIGERPLFTVLNEHIFEVLYPLHNPSGEESNFDRRLEAAFGDIEIGLSSFIELE